MVRASVDGFHQPREHRHALGRTGATVWQRSYDYRVLRRELLDPWVRGPGSAYRSRWRDLSTDDTHLDDPEAVPEGGVLVVDGVFLQRPELAGVWDLVVWLEAPDHTRVARMAARDGVSSDPGHPDQARYLQAQRLYRTACDPAGSADLVVDLTDLEAPRLSAGCQTTACPTCGRHPD